MSRYKHSEYISLYWEDMPQYLYVAGHLDPVEARRIMMFETENQYVIADPVPMYARFSMERRFDGPGHILREYNEPGRGRFKIMCAEVL